MVKFEGFEFVEGGVCAAEGFAASGVIAGIKAGNTTKRDLALIFCAEKCKTAALYTTNKVKGAPILVTKKHLEDGYAQAVIVNSGNANTCNDNGIEIAEQMCELTAQALDISAEDVIVGYTGVIVQPLSIKPIKVRIPTLAAELSPKKSSEACEAIMTTDTRKKEIAVEFELDGRKCHVGGISKGSGMIAPNMATMLAFITTDVAICHELLEKALRKVNSLTYNMVSVDGDTSTNDTLVLMSSGLAQNAEIVCEDKSYELFDATLTYEDAQEVYKDNCIWVGHNENLLEVRQYKHTWQAAQYTYANAIQDYELRFRILYAQVQDYQQALSILVSHLNV